MEGDDRHRAVRRGLPGAVDIGDVFCVDHCS